MEREKYRKRKKATYDKKIKVLSRDEGNLQSFTKYLRQDLAFV